MKIGIAKLLLPLALTALLGGCKELQEISALEIRDIDLSAVADGSYEWLQDHKFVTARVRVTVAGGRIEAIELLEHEHGPKHGGEAIIGRVLEKQSLAVDAVTGSTGSSKVILKAVESALAQGL